MSKELDFNVVGSGGQEFVEITIQPGETVISEPGAMIYMDGDIEMKAKISNNDSGFSSLFNAGARMLSGESAALVNYTNKNSTKPKTLGLSGPYPGAIIGLEMNTLNNVFYTQRGAYLAGSSDINISVSSTGSLSSSLLGGEGLFMQKLTGHGTVILHASGTIHQRDLAPGEVLLVDEGCLVGFTEGVHFDITKSSSSISTMIFGGEGAFLSRLTGEGKGGTVLLQSMPIKKLGQSLSPFIVKE